MKFSNALLHIEIYTVSLSLSIKYYFKY